MRIRESNNLYYAKTHFGLAIQLIDGLKDSEDDVMFEFGMMSMAIIHMREGVKQLQEFLAENRFNVDVPKAFRAELCIRNGEIDGFIEWFYKEFAADYAFDTVKEELGFVGRGSYIASKDAIFDIVPTLNGYVAKLSDFIDNMKCSD